MSGTAKLTSATAPAAAAPAQPARRFGRGRVLRLVFGGLGLLAALAFIGGGGAATWALETQRDGSGYFTATTHHFHSSSYALVSESLDVDTKWPTWALADRLGRIRISATSMDAAKPLFIGIARTEDAHGYLRGVEHDEVGDLELDPFGVEYRRMSGGAPASLPAAQTFWRTRASGTGTQTISWPLEKGHWSAVVMNADGSGPVSVDGELAAKVSSAWWIVTALFVVGGLSLLGGGALVYSGVRASKQSDIGNSG